LFRTNQLSLNLVLTQVWGSDSFLVQKDWSCRQRNEPRTQQFNAGVGLYLTSRRGQVWALNQ
jgi:hypothetical protein